MGMVNLNVRVDAEVKRQAESLFNSLGLNMSTAINVFLRQSIEADGLPFALRRSGYNKATLDAFQETEDILAGRKAAKSYTSVEEMFRDLEAEDDAEE